MAASPSEGFSLSSVGRSALILTGSTAAVQAIGFARELFIAAQVGVSRGFDALIIGIMLPVALTGIFEAGIRVALVPSYLEARRSGGVEQARRVAGAVLGIAAAVGLVIAAVLIVAAEPIIDLTGPGLDPTDKAAAASYLRIVAPSILFAAVSTVPFAVCQAEKRFRAIAIAIAAGPLAALLIIVVTWDTLALGSVAVGTLLGQALIPVVLWAATIRYGIAPIPTMPRAGLGLREFLRHSVPITTSSIILRLNAIFDRAIATILQPGGVGMLRYADSLIRSPIGAIGPAWSGAIYPALVESAQRTEGSMLGGATQRTVRFTIAAFAPIAFLSAAVAPVAVNVVYARGAFTTSDVDMVAPVVAAFAPAIVLLVTSSVITNALNARRSGLILLTSSLINVLLNLVLDVLLGLSLGIAGIALASSITFATTMFYKGARLARLEEGFTVRSMVRSFAFASLAAIPGSLVAAWISWSNYASLGFMEGVLTLFVLGSGGIASYVVVASLIGFGEPRELATFGWRLASRRMGAR